ncbi:protein of unknown function [Candidatus Methylopumilus turicensis]|uniref:Uncharacterized protein n=1 Tax=Candidatus Methylopumilus turicensis TaxID=1581680 RepID=A0A0B7J1P5_9PROT|nr:protein of unknown function [Candidatus Methylopumilus turicensis]
MNVTYKESKTGDYLRLFNKPKPTKGLRGLRQKIKKINKFENNYLLKRMARMNKCGAYELKGKRL